MKKATDIRIDKRTLIIIISTVAAIVIFYLLAAPLFSNVRKAGREVEALSDEMAAARQAIGLEKKFQQTGQLLKQHKVSVAIDEITKIGAIKSVNFLSINPQTITKTGQSKYPVLPIVMSVESRYRDFGLFLGALEGLQQSIVAVKSFEIEVDRGILPKIRAELVVEVYLQEGEDG